MFQWENPISQFSTQCCEIEEEWSRHGLADIEQSVEKTLLAYQKMGNKLMRQKALNQLEMMTRLMVMEGREALSRMEERMRALLREEEERMRQLK